MTRQQASILVPVLSRKTSIEEVGMALADYRKNLESVRSNLPSSAYNFASASWHYDYTDHRCPHDSWVESLAISAPSSGSRNEKREIAIEIRLLGAYHDGHLLPSYPGVSSYSLSGKDSKASKAGHGDWLIDEVRLSKGNLVLHEILLASESRWLIECRDIESRWVPHS